MSVNKYGSLQMFRFFLAHEMMVGHPSPIPSSKELRLFKAQMAAGGLNVPGMFAVDVKSSTCNFQILGCFHLR